MAEEAAAAARKKERKKCSVKQCATPCFVAPIRHVIVVFCFFLIIIQYGHRVSLSIAIVEMVEPIKKKGNTTSICSVKKGESSVIKKIEGGKIKWTEAQQSYVLLAFYIGYASLHIPGGFFCDKYGAKWFLIGTMIVSSVSTVVLPMIVMAKLNWIVIFVVRIITGFAQAFLFPGVTSLLARWAPPNERGTLGSVALSASSFGTVIGTLFSGLAIHYLNDWTMVYYIWAALGIVWCPLFWLWGSSDPIYSSCITQEELDYLQERITKKQKRNVPMKRILMDPAIWALIIAQMGHNYLFFTMITNLPKYMNNVLNYNIKSNAILSSLPFIAQYISSVLFGKVNDIVVKKHNVRTEFIRKLYTLVSSAVPGLFLVLAGFANCDRVMAQAFIILAMFFKGPFYSSLRVNGIDLTTNFSGNVMAIFNGLGAVTGIASPFVIGILAPDNTFQQWHMVFGIVCATSCFAAVIYCIFGKADRAKWDYEDGETIPPKRKRKHWYLQSHPEDTFEEPKAK